MTDDSSNVWGIREHVHHDSLTHLFWKPTTEYADRDTHFAFCYQMYTSWEHEDSLKDITMEDCWIAGERYNGWMTGERIAPSNKQRKKFFSRKRIAKKEEELEQEKEEKGEEEGNEEEEEEAEGKRRQKAAAEVVVVVVAGNTCNACRMHEEIRALSLEAIKEQILNKLGLKQAPNMTGRALPRIPPISKLMDMYGMQADQPQPLEPGISHHEEIDEYAAKTESVFALAQPLWNWLIDQPSATVSRKPVCRVPDSNSEDINSTEVSVLRCNANAFKNYYSYITIRWIQLLDNTSDKWTTNGFANANGNARLKGKGWQGHDTVLFKQVDSTGKSRTLAGIRFERIESVQTDVQFCSGRLVARCAPEASPILEAIVTYENELLTNKRRKELHDARCSWCLRKAVSSLNIQKLAPVASASNTGTSRRFRRQDQRLRHSKGSLDVLYFKFSDKVVQHRVTRAELSLWIWGSNQESSELDEAGDLESAESHEDGPVTITLQRILRGTTETGGPSLGPPLTTKHPRPVGCRGNWVTIELRRMVAEWNAKLVETNPGAEYAPYLEVQTQELDSRRGARIKRNVGLNCDEASQETRCCRYKLTVDFEKFGWDWIIAPKKYDANYCSGDCPMAFLPAYPNTHIVSLAEPPNNSGPCCAPRKLSEITMLYFDNDESCILGIATYDKMLRRCRRWYQPQTKSVEQQGYETYINYKTTKEIGEFGKKEWQFRKKETMYRISKARVPVDVQISENESANGRKREQGVPGYGGPSCGRECLFPVAVVAVVVVIAIAFVPHEFYLLNRFLSWSSHPLISEGGGGGGGGGGDSPPKCTRCRIEQDSIRTQVETRDSGRRSSVRIGVAVLTTAGVLPVKPLLPRRRSLVPSNVFLIGLALCCLTFSPVQPRQNHHQTCPGCPHQHQQQQHQQQHREHQQEQDQQQHIHETHYRGGGSERKDTSAPTPDDLRLEAIKHQILTKLGLRARPDVNRTLATVPRHLALETLYRAEAQSSRYPSSDRSRNDRENVYSAEFLYGADEYSYKNLDQRVDSSAKDNARIASSYRGYEDHEGQEPEEEMDDFYARTSEIITFAEPGNLTIELPVELPPKISIFTLIISETFKVNTKAQGSQAHLSEAFYKLTNPSCLPSVKSYTETENIEDRGRVNSSRCDPIRFLVFFTILPDAASDLCRRRTLNGQPLLEFPMSSGEPALEPLRIKRATLWTRVEFRHAHHYQHYRQSQTNQRNITLWVFRVRCGNTTHLRGKKMTHSRPFSFREQKPGISGHTYVVSQELGQHLEMVTSLGVNVGQLGWLKFDVTKVVNSWYTTNRDAARDKLTLLVDCTGCGSHVYVSTFDGHSPHVIESSLNAKGTQDPDRPFLVVRTDPAAVKRVRRRAIECSGAIKGQCCKQRFYVNFSQLGWDDWIIAPQGYYANYCRGDCAAGHRTPDTFLNYYTHVIEEYRKMDRLAGMQPCCAPLKFSPMSLIYYGPDSNIIKRDLPKMTGYCYLLSLSLTLLPTPPSPLFAAATAFATLATAIVPPLLVTIY
ncbi:Inhibin beta chain [Melipona quadrifasciata]|uniref:Inhibin beta chain n=1 Tax=Melipona quadrifasciata TaxID=166423 RepID=A0A0M9AAD1_9HYME|nr:Inhibin beta chain [Melipona quadrifasciata]